MPINLEHTMKKGYWNTQQQKILNRREIKDKIFQNMIETALNKIEQTPYGKKILEGANYYQDNRPDYYDSEHFYLEKIYIGHTTPNVSPLGHCTKESFIYRNLSEKPTTPEISRDAVYISELTTQGITIDTLKLMAQNGNKIATDLTANNNIDTSKICDWQNAAEQYSSIKEQLEHTFQENPQFNTEFMNTASDCMVNLITHECAHGNQMNNGLDNGLMTSKSLTPEDQQKEINFYFKKDENGKTAFQKWFEQQDIKTGYGTDCIDEAAVMASSYVAFIATNPSKEAQTWINNMYNQRLINGHTIEQTLADFEKQNGNYQPNNKIMQQKLACHIFNRISSDYGQINLQKIKKHTNTEIASINYNSDEIFNAIKYSYQEEQFGSIDDYISAIPEKLDDKRITQLKILSIKKKKDKNNKQISAVTNDDCPTLPATEVCKKQTNTFNIPQYQNLKPTHEH